MLKRTLLFSCFLSLGTLLAACSSDDSGSGSETPAAGGAAGTTGTAGTGGTANAGSGGTTGAGAGGTTTTGGAGGTTAGAGGTFEGAGAGGTAQGGSGGTAQGGAAGAAPFTCPGTPITSGLNSNWMAGGQARSFYADFPTDKSKPLAVIFWFHGYSDTAENFRKFGPVPDDYPEMPFVLITPEDTNLTPFAAPEGLDWDIFSAKSGTPNREGDLFEGIVGCLGEGQGGYTIDKKHIYVAGFSAGAIATNMLVSRYQDTVAASLTFSGAWFNDQAEVKAVNTLGLPIKFAWDDLVPGKGSMMLLTHGGPNDSFGMSGIEVINFENSYQLAQPFLLAAKRSFIDCAHTEGHAPHPGITAPIVIKYFKAHTLGEPSPYLGGKLDPMFPASCTLHEP